MPETVPAPPHSYPFGFVLWNTNQRIDSAELTNIGEMALRSMTALVSRLLADEPSTFPSGFFGDDCKVSINSGLVMNVAGGLGFFNVNAYDADDQDHVVYRPISFIGDQVTLDAHHATLPRIDVISIAPAYEDIAPGTRQIWDPGSNSFGPATVYTRRVVSYTLTTTAGTPHVSPSAPSTPSGHIKLAEIAVPATSGAVVVTDTRPVLRFSGSLVRGNPRVSVACGWNVGNGQLIRLSAADNSHWTYFDIEYDPTAPNGERWRGPRTGMGHSDSFEIRCPILRRSRSTGDTDRTVYEIAVIDLGAFPTGKDGQLDMAIYGRDASGSETLLWSRDLTAGTGDSLVPAVAIPVAYDDHVFAVFSGTTSAISGHCFLPDEVNIHLNKHYVD